MQLLPSRPRRRPSGGGRPAGLRRLSLQRTGLQRLSLQRLSLQRTGLQRLSLQRLVLQRLVLRRSGLRDRQLRCRRLTSPARARRPRQSRLPRRPRLPCSSLRWSSSSRRTSRPLGAPARRSRTTGPAPRAEPRGAGQGRGAAGERPAVQLVTAGRLMARERKATGLAGRATRPPVHPGQGLAPRTAMRRRLGRRAGAGAGAVAVTPRPAARARTEQTAVRPPMRTRAGSRRAARRAIRWRQTSRPARTAGTARAKPRRAAVGAGAAAGRPAKPSCPGPMIRRTRLCTSGHRGPQLTKQPATCGRSRVPPGSRPSGSAAGRAGNQAGAGRR